jgi:hypothetical protein
MKKYAIILTSFLFILTLFLPHAVAVEFNQETYDSIAKKPVKAVYEIVTKGEFKGVTLGTTKDEMIAKWGQPLYEDENGYVSYWNGIREITILRVEEDQIKWILCSSNEFNTHQSTMKKVLGPPDGHHRSGYIYNSQTEKPVTIYLSSIFAKDITIGTITPEEMTQISAIIKNGLLKKYVERALQRTIVPFFTRFADRFLSQ